MLAASRLRHVEGPIALVGSGEFTPAMETVDRMLLAAIAQSRPRVAVLPTASVPDGELIFRRWAEQGREHFARLGADAHAVLLRTREDADDPACEAALDGADLIYLSGGKPGYLVDALAGSRAAEALRRASRRGAAIAGSSAGAMALAGQLFVVRRSVRRPLGWNSALGLVPGVAVIPHYDALPEPLAALVALRAPTGMRVLGVDEETALVGRLGSWQVLGRGRVTVWHGHRRTRHRDGDVVRLPDPR